MRNFNLSRMAVSARWAPFGALAWGPFVAASACNVYGGSLPGDVAAPLGGAGTGAGASAAGAFSSGAAGATTLGGSTSGAAGGTTGGKARGRPDKGRPSRP